MTKDDNNETSVPDDEAKHAQKDHLHKTGFDPEVNAWSSKQVAEYFNSILKTSEKKDKAVYLSLVNYFNLEAEILPKKYSKDRTHSILDAPLKAISSGSSEKLISVYLNKSFALRTRAKKKKRK